MNYIWYLSITPWHSATSQNLYKYLYWQPMGIGFLNNFFTLKNTRLQGIEDDFRILICWNRLVAISFNHPAVHLWLSKSGRGSQLWILKHGLPPLRPGMKLSCMETETWRIHPARHGNLDARLFGGGSNVLTWTLASRMEPRGECCPWWSHNPLTHRGWTGPSPHSESPNASTVGTHRPGLLILKGWLMVHLRNGH